MQRSNFIEPLVSLMLYILYTVFHKKRNHARLFHYNSRISWSILIVLPPVETGMNTAHPRVYYLLNCLMTS